LRRRDLIALLASVPFASPLVTHAQNANKAPRQIVFFPDIRSATLDGWRSEMRLLDWVEGQDYIIVPSGIAQGSLGALDEAARRVVANKPDLICTTSTSYALATQRVTTSIPVVMLTSGYPVEAGVADSLAKPGRNVTGNASYAGTGVWGKLLQLLCDAKPDIKRVGVLWTYVVPAFPKEEIEPGYAELNNAARALGRELRIVEVANPDQVQPALAEISQWSPQGLLLTSLFPLAMSAVTQFAVQNGLPTIADFDWTFAAPPHPLLCYGPNYRELMQSAAAAADKILRGVWPGDIPIQRPRRFDLVVSLKTAKAIGLDLSPVLVAQADRVIE
jgi:putative tryptophan/tyrosine transport system substrate-binding protein